MQPPVAPANGGMPYPGQPLPAQTEYFSIAAHDQWSWAAMEIVDHSSFLIKQVLWGGSELNTQEQELVFEVTSTS